MLIKRIFLFFISLFISVFFFILITNLWIVFDSKEKVFFSDEMLPNKNVALVLGTSKYTSSGEKNDFFNERIISAAKLYHSKKVNHIIVSGDNRTIYYNEPRDMMDALKSKGVPEESITLDYAGLRTLDSIVRCLEVFGQSEIIIVTQEFHAYRAQFIANYYGLDAVSFVARQPEESFLSVKIRELIARPLAVFDLYIWNKNPRIMGNEGTLIKP